MKGYKGLSGNYKETKEMQVISNIDRKIKGFPMWTKGKEYQVLAREDGNLVRLQDDDGKLHWMRTGKNFIVK